MTVGWRPAPWIWVSREELREGASLLAGHSAGGSGAADAAAGHGSWRGLDLLDERVRGQKSDLRRAQRVRPSESPIGTGAPDV